MFRHALEWPPSNRTHGLLDGLLLDELTRGLETQSAVRVDGVVILEPFAEALEDRNGIRAGVHAGVVAFERLHERLAHAVALGAAHRRKAGHEVHRGGEFDGFRSGRCRASRYRGAISPCEVRVLAAWIKTSFL